MNTLSATWSKKQEKNDIVRMYGNCLPLPIDTSTRERVSCHRSSLVYPERQTKPRSHVDILETQTMLENLQMYGNDVLDIHTQQS